MDGDAGEDPTEDGPPGRDDGQPADGEPGDGERSATRTNLWRLAKILAAGLVLNYLVLPQMAGARRAWELITEVDPALLGLGVVLQVGAYLAHAQLTRAVLPARHRPSLAGMARIEVASRALSHVVPGGTAAGTALGFQLLRRRGIPGEDAAFAMGTQGLGGAVVLNVLLWGALVVSIPLRGVNPYYWTAAAIGVVAIGGFAALVLLLLRAEDRARRVTGAVLGRIPLIDPDRVEQVVTRLAARLRDLAADPPLMRRAVGWATVHWLSDAASLYVFLRAFGVAPSIDGLLIAFGVANVLAAVPVTPRGLGVVEATLITMLVAFGLPRGEAILGVVGYRLVAFWLPIPIGAAAYASIRLGSTDRPTDQADRDDDRSRPDPTSADREGDGDGEPPSRRQVALSAVRDATTRSESVRAWAARTGIGRRRRR